ncbi:helix-hairpin-helix domain-containing protein, partial [Saprospiraceae bacterium]|nr:helix-hairpin-helix domain-containing protein [Saprospiraceae bacterium]
YQHDVKAKHLSDSLDDVVEFCVNQVGVNVNTASPSLLKYVSGLNALAARRLVEHRQKINGFKNRDQLKEVNGIGDATFVQAAGFLRIRGGDEPLDSTSIHPESYELARNVIDRVQAQPEKLFPYEPDVIPQPVIASPTPGTTTAVEQKPADTTDQTVSTETPETVQASSLEAPANGSDSTVESSGETTTTTTTAESADAASASQLPNQAEATDQAADQSAKTSAPAETTPDLTADHKPPEPRPQMCPERKEAIDKIMKLDIDQVASENSAGKMLVRDVLLAIRKPDWDPRDKVKKPIFRRGIIKVDDLKPEMQLEGQIVNVVDFGVFVDIGLGESSLVHVSQLSNQYVRDPYRFCAVGDVLRVWVSEVDADRRRVKLTAIRPGSKTASPHSRSAGARKHSHGKKPYGKKPKGRSGGYQGGRKSTRTDHARRKPPKPVKPITDDMLTGDEPMRSFSDLLQFVNKKPEDAKGSKKAKE